MIWDLLLALLSILALIGLGTIAVLVDKAVAFRRSMRQLKAAPTVNALLGAAGGAGCKTAAPAADVAQYAAPSIDDLK